eukprot:1192320-Prorocentrum_minimum.AAC.1
MRFVRFVGKLKSSPESCDVLVVTNTIIPRHLCSRDEIRPYLGGEGPQEVRPFEECRSQVPDDVIFFSSRCIHRWWQKWEKYVGYMNAETSDVDFAPVGIQNPEEEHPGPIANVIHSDDLRDAFRLAEVICINAGPYAQFALRTFNQRPTYQTLFSWKLNGHMTIADASLAEGEEPKLKDKLRETFDYEIVHATVWNKLVEWYEGSPSISREVISRGHSKNLLVEVYPLVLNVLRSTCPEETREISISQMATVGELKKRLCEEYKIELNDCRLWDYYKGSNCKQATSESGGLYRYVKLEHMDATLEAAKILPCQKVLVEEKVDGKFPEAEQAGTSAGQYMPVSCSSSLTNGSSSLRLGYNLQDDVMLDPDGASRKGRAGLSNLGNTCFMNSALQCLSHTPPLAEYFLSNRYVHEINSGNPLGLGGELALAFGSLMHSLWKETASSVAPRSFKSKLGKFAPQFSGYNQQDSQELLAFLLDGMHEDLNRVRQKPYMEVRFLLDGMHEDLNRVRQKPYME